MGFPSGHLTRTDVLLPSSGEEHATQCASAGKCAAINFISLVCNTMASRFDSRVYRPSLGL